VNDDREAKSDCAATRLAWARQDSEIIADCRVFQVRRDVSISPHAGSTHDFFVLESPDWINIIPLTVDEEVEMLEETGYGGGEVTALGKVRPNPAIHNNWIHTFVARGVELKEKPVIESTEHTIVRLVPLARIPALIADGAINHALVVVGFHWLALHEKSQVPSLKSQVWSHNL
jgi:hypothetical protein